VPGASPDRTALGCALLAFLTRHSRSYWISMVLSESVFESYARRNAPWPLHNSRYPHQDQTADGIACFCLLMHEIHFTGTVFRSCPMPVRPFKLRGDDVAVRLALLDLVDIVFRRSGDTIGDHARTAVGVNCAL
jgi:hypothetical protein